MKVTFLGTNGWYNYDNNETSCVLVESDKINLIFDLGSGIKNLNKIKLKDKSTFLFISHLHIDHIIGIHYLSSINKLSKLNIVVHKDYDRKLKKIFNSPYTLKYSKYRTKIRFLTFAKNKKNNIPLKFNFIKLQHSDPSYGFKFFLDKKIISYCTDTSLCENIFKLSENTDLFILECNQLKKKNNFHLSFEEIKKNIKRFNAKKIALTHYGPEDFKTIKERYSKLKQKINVFKKPKLFIIKDFDTLVI